MPYVDLNTIHNPATGTVAPASWGDGVRDNFEFLIDPPACSVLHSTTITANTGTITTLSADSETFDNNAMHSTVTNNSRITAQTAGRYLCTVLVSFQANSSGERTVFLRKNGTTDIPGIRQQPIAGLDSAFNLTQTVVLAASDYLEVRVLQSSGSNLAVQLLEFAALYLTR